MQKNKNFHDRLKDLIDQYVNGVYDITRKFPKDEMFGVVSQFRRAALSIMLNYVEGYARRRKSYLLNFLEISYGSLKECKYLSYFSYKRKYIQLVEYRKLEMLEEEIGAMLWGILSKL